MRYIDLDALKKSCNDNWFFNHTTELTYFRGSVFECTNCGNSFNEQYLNKFKYCPNCGMLIESVAITSWDD